MKIVYVELNNTVTPHPGMAGVKTLSVEGGKAVELIPDALGVVVKVKGYESLIPMSNINLIRFGAEDAVKPTEAA